MTDASLHRGPPPPPPPPRPPSPTPPRLTIAGIESVIASEFYFTAGDGVRGESQMGTSPAGRAKSLDQLTICVLVLRNGTRVLGRNYGSIDPADHSPDTGRREARRHAIDQVWELEGYLLRQMLHVHADR